MAIKNLKLLFSTFLCLSIIQASNIKDVIKHVSINPSLLEYGGHFNEKSLPIFLSNAFKEKKITNADFAKESCLKAKRLDVEGSFNTLQLFLVTSTCQPKEASMYIIKEAREGLKEAVNLNAIVEYPGIKELIPPKMPPKGLPSIALPVGFFSYTNGGLHYIIAMPAAKGNVLCHLVNKFRDDQSEKNAERIKRAYTILGNEMANFYKRFSKPLTGSVIGKTIPHGDFHCFNIFYDEIGGHFTLIDNETMADSLKNLQTPSDDILKLFLGLFSETEPGARKDIIKGIDLKKWHDLALKNFLEGFISAYPAAQQKQVLMELKKMFNNNISLPWLRIDGSYLQSLRKNYINPVFDAIEKKRFSKTTTKSTKST